DAFADGHDEIAVALLHRPESNSNWTSVPMKSLGNDHWAASFTVDSIGTHLFTIRGWVDHFRSWRRDLDKRLKAEQDVSVDLLIAPARPGAAAAPPPPADGDRLRAAAGFIGGKADAALRVEKALDEEVFRLASLYPDLKHAATYERELRVWVDREKARFS